MFSLDDIFGQPNAVATLRRAYLADRLPHGLIFSGPVGVGKATTGSALGGLFLCENPKRDNPCGKCESCRVFAAGNHPDFHVITKELVRLHDKTGKSKATLLGIDVIRFELNEKANRKAVMGRGKVFLVEQAELMNASAQNSMLKTLEEPAGRTLIILLTSQPGSLLSTIGSRCQTIRFGSLDPDKVRKELEKRGIDPAEASEAAQWSEGSLGEALQLIDDGILAPARKLAEKIDGLFAGTPAPELPDWFKATADAYAEKQLEKDELGSKDNATRQGLILYLRLASQHIRGRIRTETDSEAIERACQAIDAIAQSEIYLDANVNIPIIFQQLAATLAEVLSPAAAV